MFSQSNSYNYSFDLKSLYHVHYHNNILYIYFTSHILTWIAPQNHFAQ